MPDAAVQIIVVEDDPFARNWMTLLLARDWRTHVVDDLEMATDLRAVLDECRQKQIRVDMIVLDCDFSTGSPDQLTALLAYLNSLARPPRLLCLSVQPRPDLIPLVTRRGVGGYLVKAEIGYSLAWAAALCATGKYVVTPSVKREIYRVSREYPPGAIMLDGRKPLVSLTERELDIARLALLFSMERVELADEIVLQPGSASNILTDIFAELHVDELISGREPILERLGGGKLLARKVAELVKDYQQKQGKKIGKNREALGFHLLTLPEVTELN